MIDRTLPYIGLMMRREAIGHIVVPAPKLGCSLRYYRGGDRAHWARIETSAGEFEREADALEAFDKYYGDNLALLPERMLFLTDPFGLPIGTATAWFEGSEGRLHWVGICEKWQGKGLSRSLLGAAVNRMVDLNRDESFLTTQPSSWVAIKLYLELGFTPFVRTPEEKRGWEMTYEKLAHK